MKNNDGNLNPNKRNVIIRDLETQKRHEIIRMANLTCVDRLRKGVALIKKEYPNYEEIKLKDYKIQFRKSW